MIAMEKAKFDKDEFNIDMIEFYMAIIGRKELKKRYKINKELTEDEKLEMMEIDQVIE